MITFTIGGEKHVLPIDGGKTLRAGSVSPSVAMEVEEVGMTKLEERALDLLHPGTAAEVNLHNFSILGSAFLEMRERHEAYKQEVSDAVESRWMNILAMKCEDVFSRFIISKPDPLVDAWLDAFPGNHIDDAREECAKISAALAARGLEIREKQP